jgi:hypothetical protein
MSRAKLRKEWIEKLLHCKRQYEAKAKVEAHSGLHDEMANFATI